MTGLITEVDPQQSVRASDSVRFLATQFAPAGARKELYTLYAFDLEIRKICRIITDPTAGEIRIQWWREVLSRQRDEEMQAYPLARSVSTLLERYNILANRLEGYFDYQLFELYGEPLKSRNEFEVYARHVTGTIVQWTCMVLNKEDPSLPDSVLEALSCAEFLLQRVLQPLMAGIDNPLLSLMPDDFFVEIDRFMRNPYIIFSKQDRRESAVALIGEIAHYLEKARLHAEAISVPHRPALLPFSMIEPTIDYARKKLAKGRMKPVKFHISRLIYMLWKASRRWPCF